MDARCVICFAPLEEHHPLANGREWCHCHNCGYYEIAELVDLGVLLGDDNRKRAVLSHALRRAQSQGTPVVTMEFYSAVINRPPPTPGQQCENVIRWLGENLYAPGVRVWMQPASHRAVAGSVTDAGFNQVIQHLIMRELVDAENPYLPRQRANVTLTVDGWAHYERLAASGSDSHIAFMAMQYGDKVLDALFTDVLKPAVRTVGFELRRLDENPKAGLIDDRLRVEIRNARFLLADLSHDNKGAYWEAGFAEGLGKPVIYLCQAERFRASPPHFDTNHHLTVLWDPAAPDVVSRTLIATIRATLPEEAKMT